MYSSILPVMVSGEPTKSTAVFVPPFLRVVLVSLLPGRVIVLVDINKGCPSLGDLPSPARLPERVTHLMR